jgi:hypothetical protein
VSTFAIDNLRGKPIEEAFESLLTAAGIRWGKNPATGTNDPQRADYDEWMHSETGLLVECKANHAAQRTGNVAIEIDILDKSKAHYFLIAFPVESGWYGQVLDRMDIHRILTATRLTLKGRFHRFPRVHTGQSEDTFSALVPIKDLMQYGESVQSFIAAEAEHVEFWNETLTQRA